MTTFDERQQAWEEFLQRWPLRTLSKLTPSTYNKSGDQDTFTYWLEFGPGRLLGSIKGGDSSKLGLYERKNEPKGARAHVQAGDVYSWKKKYGTSVDEAFTTIRARIVEVAKAASKGDLQRVQEIDLEHVLKWKVAFIYQDISAPCVLPIYNYKSLCAIAGETDKRVTQAELYARLLELRGEEPVLAYGFDLWNAMEDESDDEEVDGGWESEGDTKEKEAYEPPLNQILFGPPGTGKTYNTINQALAILAPEFLAKNRGDDDESRECLKAEFDRFVTAERVRFVTFHQSFSYEDFVEGLRADSEAETGQVKYSVESGVFKRLCDDARTRPASDLGVRGNPAIWKISINGTGSSPTKSYCLDNGEARIGWGKTGDLREDYEQSSYYQSLGGGDKGTLSYFAEQMVVGDILLCIHSAEQIGSIGVVTGDYRYEEQVPAGVIGDYQHVRSVRWLYRDINLSILPLNDERQFTLKTVYAMSRFTWADLLSYVQQQKVSPVEPVTAAEVEREPYVLIIDEINRGNVSRIFGELITLIEESKREGADEALSVKLPYSKKPFSVPKNVYLIGTMNTADRSLAGLDIALRRRFVFREMPPRPELLKDVLVQGLNIGKLLRVMNQRIEVLLDRDHCLGHAYFMPLKGDPTLARLESIFSNQILSLLQEYFFEDWQRIQWVLNDHRKPVVDRFVEQDKQDVAALFGNISVPAQGGVWRINDAAFKRFSAYAGVIAVNAKAEVSAEELEEASA
ncbi:AAA family ATPase [Ectopseudomonas chengduensis]